MHNCYSGHSIFKAGHEVLETVRIMVNVQSNYYNIELSEKHLLNHYDVYGAILGKTCKNVSNFQFVINFESHNTLPSTKKLLALSDTNGIQGLLMCPTKNVAELEKNKRQVHFTHQQSVISSDLQYINTSTVQNILALQYIYGFCQNMQLHKCTVHDNL
jgi:hypothetical protein